MKRSLWILAAGTLLALGSLNPAVQAANSQQQKMKSCNADAKTKGLKGDDRKKYLSDCLKGAS